MSLDEVFYSQLYDRWIDSNMGKEAWDKARKNIPGYDDDGVGTMDATRFLLSRFWEWFDKTDSSKAIQFSEEEKRIEKVMCQAIRERLI